MFFGAALVLGIIQLTYCDREHKVHNIVLYPDRHSWCQTTAIKQVVASPGYESVTIDNNVCVGACYSYSIPRTQPAEPGELIGPYCDSCQPVETQCYHVTLHADGKNVDGPRTIQKRVQIITNCTCLSCETVQKKDCEVLDHSTSELPSDLFALLHPALAGITPVETKPQLSEEVPELLHLVPLNKTELKFNASHTTNEQRFELNSKLIDLLKSIQNEADDFNYDKEQLRELLQIIEGSEHKLSDKNLVEFVNFVSLHTDDLEWDLNKLKEVLTAFRRSQELQEKHRNFGLGNLERGSLNNVKIDEDLEDLSKKAALPANFGVEGSHHGLGRLKGNHVGMGIQTDDQDTTQPPETVHHHVGETQRIGLDLGHLIRGPHGSLAFAPDAKVEEKLNLDSDLVKPNHEGAVITYENHPKKHKTLDDLLAEHV